MSATSRRAILAGIAAAVPAAPAIASIASHADAELLELGAKLDLIITEWRGQLLSDRERSAAFDAALERATGIAEKDAPKWSDNSPAALQYRETSKRISKQMASYEMTDEGNPWNDIHDRMFPLARDILSRKAETIAGLTVQTKAILLAAADLWDPIYDEQEPDERREERRFIEAVCAFVGIGSNPYNMTV